MYSEVPDVPFWVVTLAQILIGLAMVLTGWRLWTGPHMLDRIVAIELLAALIMAQFVTLVFRSGFVSYLDVGTAVAIISFLGTVAFARYLEKEDPER